MKRHDVAAVSRPLPLRGFAGHRHLLAAVPRLVAEHGPGASLARQAVAHSVARGFAFDREVKLPATAGGMACHCSLHGTEVQTYGTGAASERQLRATHDAARPGK